MSGLNNTNAKRHAFERKGPEHNPLVLKGKKRLNRKKIFAARCEHWLSLGACAMTIQLLTVNFALSESR